MADSLTLTPVGVGAAYARPGEVQSAYLVTTSETHVCLDLGAGALNRLQEHVAPEQLTAIVVSHVHADHCVDLLSLRIYMTWGPGRGHTIRVVGPAELPGVLRGWAGASGWEWCQFTALDRSEGAMDIGDLRLSWAEVPHTEPTFALRLDAGSASVTYSADCGPNDALVTLAAQTDILVAECSLGLEPSGRDAIHLSARDAGALARRAGAGRLLLTHCYPEHDRDLVLGAAAATFGGSVDWARQGEAVITSTS